MRYWFVFVFSFINSLVFGQPGKVPQETVDGQSYYVHTVKPGNTLWWIHETYNVPVDEIVKANPGSEKGVSIGQKIRVPFQNQNTSYTVLPGESLYSLSKKFVVSIDSLVKWNPGTENGIKVGQVLKVQFSPKENQEKNKIQPSNVSKNPSDQIKSENRNPKQEQKTTEVKLPENKPNDKSTETKLTDKSTESKMPEVKLAETKTTEVKSPESKSTIKSNSTDATKVTKSEPVKIPVSDTIIEHIVKDNETLYTLSKRYMVTVEDLQNLNHLNSYRIKPGDNIKIQIKKEQKKNVETRQIEMPLQQRVDSFILFPKKSTYKIALLLPFNLDKQDPNGDYISGLATEFYMGAKLALDSLERIGFNADIYVFDVKNDTVQTKKLLAQNDMNDIDLVFGPLFPENADVVARWSKKIGARMICPAAVQSSIVKNNPYVYTAVPNDVQLQEGLAAYIAKKHLESQVVLIRPSGDKEAILYDAFRSTFLAQNKHPKLIEANLDNYATFLKREMQTVLIFPTNEKSLVIKFMNSMNSNGSKLNPEFITICGTKEWLGVDELKANFRNKYHFHYSSPNDLNFDNEQTKNILRTYRRIYNEDLSKMSAQGFDVVFHFCSSMLMGMPQDKLIMNEFVFRQKGKSNGFQNSKCFILQQKDYELINVGD